MTPRKKPLRIGVVDFFAGCGGTSYGFASADVGGTSVNIVAGIDIDPYCCATYSSMVGAPSIQLDIASLVDHPRRLDVLLTHWHLDRFDKVVLVGCAPCQGFAAHRKAVTRTDARRHLFVMFCKLAERIRPDAIFMENVPDLFSRRHWKYYQQGRTLLQKAGLTVRSRVYNFATFGLPQERFRAIMMALPHPFDMPEPLLHHNSFQTVRDAISHLPPLASGECSTLDPMHIVSNHRPGTLRILRKVPPNGGNRPVGVGPGCLDRARRAHGGYTDVYGRLAWDRPAVTITARCRTPSCGRFAHPEQHRGLSVREAALLQGFPPQFVFDGPFDDKYKQIGNAVPPMVAKQMARHLILAMSHGSIPHPRDQHLDITSPIGPGFAITINGIKRKRRNEARYVAS
jgi:DNA (cytosine-5)-methyltransferase 1